MINNMKNVKIQRILRESRKLWWIFGSGMVIILACSILVLKVIYHASLNKIGKEYLERLNSGKLESIDIIST